MQKVLYYKSMSDLYLYDGEYGKRGYLKENFRIFNINDKSDKKFEFHYHEFNKIVFFISGNVKYIIEGKEYKLNPFDVLLVPKGDMHKPVIDQNINYNRIILWIDSKFLNRFDGLDTCFSLAKNNRSYLIKTNHAKVFDLVLELSKCNENDFGYELLTNALFVQIMVHINQNILSQNEVQIDYKCNKQIDSVIDYINNHLFDSLSVDSIAKEFFISRYYLMHKFKEATGKPLLSYIKTKRLLAAAALLTDGESAKTACFKVGFKDYSVFLKAFKNEFDLTPTEYKKIYSAL